MHVPQSHITRKLVPSSKKECGGEAPCSKTFFPPRLFLLPLLSLPGFGSRSDWRKAARAMIGSGVEGGVWQCHFSIRQRQKISSEGSSKRPSSLPLFCARCDRTSLLSQGVVGEKKTWQTPVGGNQETFCQLQTFPPVQFSAQPLLAQPSTSHAPFTVISPMSCFTHALGV